MIRGLCVGLVLALAPSLDAQASASEDVAFAIDALGRECAELLHSKGIDWPAVSAPLLEDAQAVHDDGEELLLLRRLLARLKDGHAQVQVLEAAGEVQVPPDPRGPKSGPGMLWCRIGDGIFVRNAWSAAARIGLQPGMEVLAVDGQPVEAWLGRRIAELSDTVGFSSPQHAFFYACSFGLQDYEGARHTLELRKAKGKKTQRELVWGQANQTPDGPAFPPADLKRVSDAGDVRYGWSAKKYGYLHLRRAPDDLPEQVDAALAELGAMKGLILDFRGNSGGGFDHDALLGRFVPTGKVFSSGKDYPSAGAHPYGGPIVAIVDATVRSAGETAAGLFKDDGRGYVIGESPTAGMSSQKTTLELPSKKFALYVSVASNMGRYNGGRGLEGVGVVPHRIVSFEPKDLEEGVDTLIRTAEELLARFPQKDVRYDPKAFGWKR